MENFENSGFELFTAFKGKFLPKITISKPGGLSFSSGLYNKYELAKYSYVQLLFNKQKNAIAIKFLDVVKENSVILKHRKDNKGGFTHVKSFIDAHGLEKYYGKRFIPKEEDLSGWGKVLIIDLNEAS